MIIKVKNLKDTSECPHHKKLIPFLSKIGKCAVNKCPKKQSKEDEDSFACHIIMQNQNDKSGKRYLVPMCRSHNQQYGIVLEVDGRIEALEILNYKCGHL